MSIDSHVSRMAIPREEAQPVVMKKQNGDNTKEQGRVQFAFGGVGRGYKGSVGGFGVRLQLPENIEGCLVGK